MCVCVCVCVCEAKSDHTDIASVQCVATGHAGGTQCHSLPLNVRPCRRGARPSPLVLRDASTFFHLQGTLQRRERPVRTPSNSTLETICTTRPDALSLNRRYTVYMETIAGFVSWKRARGRVVSHKNEYRWVVFRVCVCACLRVRVCPWLRVWGSAVFPQSAPQSDL